MPFQHHCSTRSVVNLDKVVGIIPLIFYCLSKVLLTLNLAVETSETTLVGREFNRIFSGPRHLYAVVWAGVRRAPIKYKIQPLMRVGDSLIFVVGMPSVRVAISQNLILLYDFEHLLIEQAELPVAQETVIGQRPLTACMSIAPIVTLARESIHSGCPNSLPIKFR